MAGKVNCYGEPLVADGNGNLVAMQKLVRDQHRRELTASIVGFVWLGEALLHASDTFGSVPVPQFTDVAHSSVSLADAVLEALEAREQQ